MATLIHRSPPASTSLSSASASISTRYSSPTSVAATSVLAGRIAPNRAPCARATASQSPMFLTKTRVRTTSASAGAERLQRAFDLVDDEVRLGSGVAARRSARSPSVAVVPDTLMRWPWRTARAKPASCSHDVPLKHSVRPSARPSTCVRRRHRVADGD